MVGHLLRREVAQYELQAAAQHGDGDFVRVGGGQDEFDVFGRLFQRFEHGVERGFGEHVHFVDDIDFVFAGGGRVLGVFQHFADVVDAGVGRGVDFQQIHKTPCVDVAAGLALAARFAVLRVFAVQAFGQDAGDGGFAHAACACEQVGVVQAAFVERVLQRFYNVLLADQIGKGFGSPLAGEDLISCHNITVVPNNNPGILTFSPAPCERFTRLADKAACTAKICPICRFLRTMAVIFSGSLRTVSLKE